MNINELTKKVLHIKSLYNDFEKKKSYKSWTIEESYAGLVSDVGDLGRMILSKEGFREIADVDKNLGRELGEILYNILLLANHYNVDLEKSFINEINRLEQELSK